jgi:O-antigen ligase
MNNAVRSAVPRRPQLRETMQPVGRPLRLIRALKTAPMPVARDAFHITLLTLVFLNISRFHQQVAVLKAMRPELVLTLACVALAFIKPSLLSKRPLLETWPARGAALFGVLACLSAPFGISLGHSAVFILNTYAKTLVFTFLIIAAVRSARDLYSLVWAGVLSAGWLAYTSLFVFRLSNYHGYARLAHLDTYDANDVGLVMLVGLGLTLLAFQTSRKLGKIVCGVTMLGIGATLARSGSRGAFVGLLVLGGALLLLAHGVSVAKRLGFVFAVLLGMLLFAPPGYWEQMQTIANPKADYNWNTVNGRREVALRGVGYMLQYPVFGIGINNFARAECTISDKAKAYTAGEPLWCTPPHNAYIEAAAETGIPGGILWLVMVPGGVIWVRRMRRRIPKAWATGDPEQRFLYLCPLYFAVLLAGFSAGALFLSFTWYDVTYYIFALLAGLQVAVSEKLRRTSLPVAGRDVRIGYGRG